MTLSGRDWQAVVREAASRAVGEDVGPVDLTSRLTFSEPRQAKAVLVAKERCVVAGLVVAEAVFREVDGSLQWRALVQDGAMVEEGSPVAEVRGLAGSILTGERCALNFLQRLSGVATKTAEYVQAVKGTRAKILDTRKTTPGLRALERYAVRCGGGHNHRAGLYDGILFKENHLTFLGKKERQAALTQAKAEHGEVSLVIEADSVPLACELLGEPVDRILLDNLTPKEVAEVVALRKERGLKVDLEASGGVTLERASALAKAGVEWISVGALTHSARAIDFCLDIEPNL